MEDPLHSPTSDAHGLSHSGAPDDSQRQIRHDSSGEPLETPNSEYVVESPSPIQESFPEHNPAPEQISEPIPVAPVELISDMSAEMDAATSVEPAAPIEELPLADVAPEAVVLPSFAYVGMEPPQRRSLRNNLFTVLGLSLASFVLTAWVLVRVESPFGLFASGPGEVANAQLLALDRGEMRTSYDMFSEQYRKQVTFDQWRQLVVTHWRLFHAEVLSAEPPEQSGARVLLEIHLRGADEKDYRARYTLVRAQGRWWVDDLHWAEEPDNKDLQKI